MAKRENVWFQCTHFSQINGNKGRRATPRLHITQTGGGQSASWRSFLPGCITQSWLDYRFLYFEQILYQRAIHQFATMKERGNGALLQIGDGTELLLYFYSNKNSNASLWNIFTLWYCYCIRQHVAIIRSLYRMSVIADRRVFVWQ